MKLIDPILGFQNELKQIRRTIHAHPELSYEEFKTADLVAEKLTSWGIPIIRGMGVTGVVGIIKNGTTGVDFDARIWNSASSRHTGGGDINAALTRPKCRIVL